MKNITVLDTNVILRYLLNDHPQHFEIANAFMTRIKSGYEQAYIPDSVLAECIYVLSKVYKIPKSKVCDVLIQVIQYKGISKENSTILQNALGLFSENNVDIVDAIVYATAQYYHWGILSFDHDLKKLS